MKNLAYLLALHTIDGLGSVRLQTLLQYFEGDPKLVWEGDSREWKQLRIPENVTQKLLESRKTLDPLKYSEEIEKQDIKILTLFAENYPKRLKDIYDPPLLLYCKGDVGIINNKSVAVVGTRKVTNYGRTVTAQLVRELVGAGLIIVSGLARGVDTIAHKTTIDNGGLTVAVLGAGVNVIYPPDNEKLYYEIIESGGLVLSEQPPDQRVSMGVFPSRNRIISGLSSGVLVTEAAEDSGSLITASQALEQGRDVYAVPGPITSGLSKGPANLIKQGAKLVYSSEDILEEMGFEGVQNEELRVKNLEGLSEFERQIVMCLENEEKHIDEICRELKKTSSEVSATLVKLEILGVLKNVGGGVYLKC